jgi:hypothetical protein
MGIQTLRPNGTVRNAGITAVGGTPAGVVSDNSDATYDLGTRKDAYLAVSYGDLTPLGGTQRVKSCQMRVRSAADVSGTAASVTSYSLQNFTAGGTPAGSTTLRRASTALLTQSAAIAYVGPGGRAWTEAEVNAVGSWTQWSLADGGVTHFARVHELYLDVDINDQPIITGAPTVTNFTNNATPTVAWVYTDADNDPQTHFWVKIFDAATVANGNFSPETSSPVWSSGDRLGADANIDVTPANDTGVPGPITNKLGSKPAGRSLVAGVVYTAYVKAAQDWPGPQGSIWWSAWAASATFQITFVAPYPPVFVSAAVLADANAYRASLTIDTPVNLLTLDNSSFEASIGNWVADANMATPIITGSGHSCGANSLVLKSSAAGNMVARGDPDFLGAPYVDVGKTITVIGSFKGTTVTRSCSIGIRYFNAAVVQVGADVYGADITDATGGAADANWTQASLVGTVVPAGAVTARVLARVKSTAAAGEVHLLDCVSIHEGTSTVWTSGGLVNDQGDLLVERGERLSAARGPAENWAHPQVWSCGTVLRNQGYGFSWNFNDRLDWMWLDKLIPAPGATPSGMLRWSPTVATALQPIAFGWWPYFPAKDYAFPVVPGQLHVWSIWAWCDSGTFVATPKIEWRNEDETLNSTTTGGNVTLTTAPQQIIVVGTAPAAPCTMARGVIANPNADNTRHVFFTRCGFGLGSIPVDGKQPMGGPIVWTPVRFPFDEFGSLPLGLDSQQRRVYSDFEYPTGRPALYRASIVYSLAATRVASPYSAGVVVYGTPPPVTLLRSTTDPMLQVAANRRKAAQFAQVQDAGVFRPLGRDGAPVQVRDWVGGEDGQLIVVTSTEAQFARLRALIAAADVLQVQWAQGGRSYIQITDRTFDETISGDTDWCDADGTQSWIRARTHTLVYIETAAP